MFLRREVPADVPHIRRVHFDAFGALDHYEGDPVEHELVDALRADPGWVPSLSIVAEGAVGDIVGHVVATEGRIGDVPAVGIGPLGVTPGRHGTGVGTALMHAVIAAADSLGYPAAALLGEPDYYTRFGFVPAAALGIESPDASWGDYFQARTLGSYAGETGGFRYAAPFDDL